MRNGWVFEVSDPVSKTERSTVRTYVPEYQKVEWAEHAESLGMSQSEFVRTMVQAGRKELGVARLADSESTDPAPETAHSDHGEMRDEVIEALKGAEPLGWNDLIDRLVGDIEAEIESVLETLQDENRVRYRPRKEGYVLTNEHE